MGRAILSHGGHVHLLGVMGVQVGAMGGFVPPGRGEIPIEGFKKLTHPRQALRKGRESGVHPEEHAAAQAGGGGGDPQPLVAAPAGGGLFLHPQHAVGVLKALHGLGSQVPAGQLLLQLLQKSRVFHKHSPFSCK